MSQVKRDDGLMYWIGKQESKIVNSNNGTGTSSSSDRLRIVPVSEYLSIPNSLEVESSSYALLTLVARSDIDNAIPVLRWLISKQNSNGGFSSTQDTVIGLQALGAIAQQISTSTLKINAIIKYGKTSKTSSMDNNDNNQLPDYEFNFTPENALVLQQIELPANEVEWIAISATGFGSAIIQVSYQYNLAVSAEMPAFFLNPQKDKTSTENYLQLSVCT